MTTKTEALKLALDALISSQDFTEASSNGKVRRGWGNQLDEAAKAITTIKEALAQQDLVTKEVSLPEQEYLDAVTASLMREGVDKHRAREYAQHFFKMAQPEQEPAPTPEQHAITEMSRSTEAPRFDPHVVWEKNA
jgi:hypothetical protein